MAIARRFVLTNASRAKNKMKFLSEYFQKLEPQKDTQTHRRDREYYHAVFTGDKTVTFSVAVTEEEH